MKNYKKILVILLIIIFSLCACGSSTKENKEKHQDISFSKSDRAAYTSDELMILIYNGYEVVDTNKTFDEETKEYTVTVKIKKVINNDIKGD